MTLSRALSGACQASTAVLSAKRSVEGLLPTETSRRLVSQPYTDRQALVRSSSALWTVAVGRGAKLVRGSVLIMSVERGTQRPPASRRWWCVRSRAVAGAGRRA
ncbi:hypothetical protein FRACA_350008 [Frankia canadensis]|uniref:Uncharacterized protein n=1 Tax=Frankia canadensis TaxID=1836972 RepID=A0A2I2KVA6_9ACTN|nr:hypothetical protein FRACA_350008 [Frankia canadensis]SOU56874.1 hypothetical protein FRACA_350008 [Frankia canadensis]